MAGAKERRAVSATHRAKQSSGFETRVLKPGVAGRRLNGREQDGVSLAETIEVEIIPRIMLAHRAGPSRSGSTAARTPGPVLRKGDVEEFTRLILLSGDLARRFVADLVAHKVRLETIFLELLAPSARRLGDLWNEDICDFCQVTLGLGHLQAMLRENGHSCSGSTLPSGEGRRALLTTAPGEQHTFGVSMVSEFLIRSGWDVSGSPTLSRQELARRVRRESFALVGLSLGAERNLDNLESCIETIRRNSRHESTAVMVGGPFFVDHPEVARQVGADSIALDAEDAAIRAEDLHRSRQPA